MASKKSIRKAKIHSSTELTDKKNSQYPSNLPFFIYPTCFFLIGLVYLYWMPRSVTLEDSGEFLLTAQYLGISHPPGYPLYALLGHAIQLLPFASTAVAMHTLSVIMGLCTLYLLMRLLDYWLNDKVTSLIAAVSLGSTPVFATNAMTAEVYLLNTMLLLVCFVIAEKLREHYSQIKLGVLGFFIGLTMSNHWPLTVLALPSLALLIGPRTLNHIKKWLILTIGVLVGMSPYIGLLTFLNQSDMLFIGPINSIKELFEYIFRQEYSGIEETYQGTFTDEVKFATYFIFNLFRDFYGVGFVIAAIGIYKGSKLLSYQRYLTCLLVIASSSIFLRFFWRNSFTRHTIQWFEYLNTTAYLGVAIALAIGLKFLQTKYPDRSQILVWCVLSLALASFGINRVTYREWEDSFAKDYAELVLRTLPENSVLLVKSDTDAGPISYLHYGEGMRTDLIVVSQVAALLPGKPFSRSSDIASGQHRIKLLNFIATHLAKNRRVFLTEKSDYFDEEGFSFPYKLIPYGMYFEISESGIRKEIPDSLIEGAKKILDDFISEKYSKRYISLRENVLTAACDTVNLAGLNHQAFSQISNCALIRAQRLHVDMKKHFEADQWFSVALRLSDGLTPKSRAFIMRQKLLNTIHWMREIPAEKAQAMLQNNVEEATEFALAWPDCKNQLGINLLEIHRQQPALRGDWGNINRQFGNCRAIGE